MKPAPRRAALVFAIGLLGASHVHAEGPLFQASLSCPPAAAPGRIVCELVTRATAGKLVWSDALVVRAPVFARPLRSRFVAQLGATPATGEASAKLALVATEVGDGKLELLARGVICHEGPAGEWCGPVRAAVTTDLWVGPPAAKAP